jgi:predicted RNA methylase
MISPMPEPLHRRATALLRRHGLAGACAHAFQIVRKNFVNRRTRRRELAEEAAFDRRRGVRTSARIDPETLNVIGPHQASAVRYQPISESSFRTLLAALTEQIGPALPGYTFIDLGCGMGKVLLLATEYPFRQILGVEYAPDLAAICENNLRQDLAMAERRCPNASVVVADAAEFAYPQGPLVVFLFNPFGPPVLSAALRNLRQTASQSSQVYVVYHNAEHARLMEEAGFTQVWANNGDRIYRLGSASA